MSTVVSEREARLAKLSTSTGKSPIYIADLFQCYLAAVDRNSLAEDVACETYHTCAYMGVKGAGLNRGGAKSKMLLTIFVDVCLALGAYLIADGLIGSLSTRESFIKAGLFGKDLNKSTEDRV